MAEAHVTLPQPAPEADLDAAAAQAEAQAGTEGEADLDAAAALLQGAAPHPADAQAEVKSQQAIALHERESAELQRMAAAALQPPHGAQPAESRAEAADTAKFERQLRSVAEQWN